MKPVSGEYVPLAISSQSMRSVSAISMEGRRPISSVLTSAFSRSVSFPPRGSISREMGFVGRTASPPPTLFSNSRVIRTSMLAHPMGYFPTAVSAARTRPSAPSPRVL
jgi:hypothetical protein